MRLEPAAVVLVTPLPAFLRYGAKRYDPARDVSESILESSHPAGVRSMGDFKKLLVWQRARHLVAQVYSVTDTFPAAERYGLTAQVRRATVSISANIAESSGRLLPRDQARLLQIALGSARELESHCLIAGDLGFLVPDQVALLSAGLDEVQRMLVSMIRIVSRGSPVSRRQSPVSRPTAATLR